MGVPLVMKKASAWFLVFAQLWGMESTPGIKAQEKELFPLESGRESRERTDTGEGLWCQAQLYRQGSTPEEKEMTKTELLTSQGKKQKEKELSTLFPSRGGRGRRVNRPRKTAIWLWLCSSAKLQSS